MSSSFDGATFFPVRCESCGLVGLTPRLPLDELLRYYEGLETRPDLEDKIRSRFRPRVEWVRREVPEGGRLLDIGCGAGQFPHAMKEAGWEAEGFETDPIKVARGRAEFGLTIHQGAFDEWDPEPARYDAITGWHVLEHFIDPTVALQNARDALVPETGRLFLEVPNFRSLGRALTGPSWVHYDVPYHQHFFTSDTLRRMCEHAGLEVLHISSRPLDSDWWSLKRSLQRHLEGHLLRPVLRPLVSFRPIAWLLVHLGSLLGYTETLQVQARRAR